MHIPKILIFLNVRAFNKFYMFKRKFQKHDSAQLFAPYRQVIHHIKRIV